MELARNYVELKRRGLMVDVIDKRSGEVLAWCFLGDEDNLEKIADILSEKKQPQAAQELRELARGDRRLWLLRKPPAKATVRRLVMGA